MPNSEVKIVQKNVAELIPYEKNPRNNKKAIKYVQESIDEFGFKVPIVIDSNNVVVAGHTRLIAAKNLKMHTVPCIVADDLTPEQIKAFRLADNKVGEFSKWDKDLLARELKDIKGLDMSEFGFNLNKDMGDGLEDRYSAELGKVIYEPGDSNHKVSDLYEMPTRFDDMIEALDDEELKKMLRIRACWFCKFNFAKIADYYAYQATPEEQRVMEALALVLLDKDQLIENGFADLMGTVDTNDDYE